MTVFFINIHKETREKNISHCFIRYYFNNRGCCAFWHIYSYKLLEPDIMSSI